MDNMCITTFISAMLESASQTAAGMSDEQAVERPRKAGATRPSFTLNRGLLAWFLFLSAAWQRFCFHIRSVVLMIADNTMREDKSEHINCAGTASDLTILASREIKRPVNHFSDS